MENKFTLPDQPNQNRSKKLEEIAAELYSESKKMTRHGFITLVIGILATIALFYFMLEMTKILMKELIQMHNEIHTKNNSHEFQELSSLILFVGVRTIVSGIIGGYFIVFILRLCKACFDQSTRFTKRRHATEFLIHISGEDQNLKEQMHAFLTFNQNIESAFSYTSDSYHKTFSLGKFGPKLKDDKVILNSEIDEKDQ